jgi:intein/homing endonuclease
MVLKFREYINQDYIADAILGTVGGNQSLGEAEKRHLLQRNTREFSSDIIDRLRRLGIISNLVDDNQQRYSDIINSINQGITIGELIEKIRGPILAPNAIIKPTEA